MACHAQRVDRFKFNLQRSLARFYILAGQADVDAIPIKSPTVMGPARLDQMTEIFEISARQHTSVPVGLTQSKRKIPMPRE